MAKIGNKYEILWHSEIKGNHQLGFYTTKRKIFMKGIDYSYYYEQEE